MIGLTMLRVPRSMRLSVLAVIGVGAGFSLSIMLAAWDLWRFFAWGDATALMLCGLEFRFGGPYRAPWRPGRLMALSSIILVSATASLDSPTFIWGINVVGLADSREAPFFQDLARLGEQFGDFYNRLPLQHEPQRLNAFKWHYNRPHSARSDATGQCAGGRVCEVNYRPESPRAD